jgi:hypothetical protein
MNSVVLLAILLAVQNVDSSLATWFDKVDSPPSEQSDPSPCIF